MILKQCKLTNFMIADRDITFSLGTNSILGTNGVGKSSIIMAIQLALFSSADRSNHTLIRHGEKSAKIEIELNVDNVDYLITREFGTISTMSIQSEKEKVDAGVTAGVEYISGILGLNGETFNNTTVLSSSSLLTPFNISASDRKNLFNKLFDIHKYEFYWQELRKPISTIEKRLAEHSGGISIIDSAQEEELPQYDIEVLKKNLKKYKAELQKLNEQDVRQQGTRDEVDELRDKYSKITNGINSLGGKISQISKDEIKIKEEIVSIEESRCPYCGQALDDITKRAKIEGLQNKLESLSKQANTLMDKHELLTEESERVKAQAEKLKLQIDNNLTQQVAEQTRKVSELGGVIKSYIIDVERRKKFVVRKKDLELKMRQDKYRKDTLELIRTGFRQIPKLMNQQITQNASLLASDICSILTNKNVKIKFNSDYDLMANFDGNELQYFQLSEGQKVITALSLRIALAKLLTNQSLLILDEPTINLDESVKLSLAENLPKLGFKQLIIISHDHIFDSDNTIILE